MTTEMEIWGGRTVPRVGMGCWAIGGRTANDGPSTSYGDVDDAQSRAALRLGYEMGARVFDTAAGYGAGHSETLIGEEISKYEDAVIVTKCGFAVNDKDRINGPEAVTPEAVRETVEGSRRRLRRDRIDLILLHLNELPIDRAAPVFDTFEALVGEGKVAYFGWSTDHVERARAVADRPGFVAVENDYNLFTPAAELMELVESRGWVSICRLPLAMGLLTGKFRPDAQLSPADVRAQAFPWLRFFKNGQPNADYLKRIDPLRDLLQSGGRSLAQGALSWILATSPRALPVPGFKTEAQVRDNLGTLQKGPLEASTVQEISKLLAGFEPVA